MFHIVDIDGCLMPKFIFQNSNQSKKGKSAMEDAHVVLELELQQTTKLVYFKRKPLPIRI